MVTLMRILVFPHNNKCLKANRWFHRTRRINPFTLGFLVYSSTHVECRGQQDILYNLQFFFLQIPGDRSIHNRRVEPAQSRPEQPAFLAKGEQRWSLKSKGLPTHSELNNSLASIQSKAQRVDSVKRRALTLYGTVTLLVGFVWHFTHFDHFFHDQRLLLLPALSLDVSGRYHVGRGMNGGNTPG